MSRKQREWSEIVGVGRGVIVTEGPPRDWRLALALAIVLALVLAALVTVLLA